MPKKRSMSDGEGSLPPPKHQALEGTTGTPRYGQRHICTTCGQTFTFICALVRHERTLHGGGGFPCQMCGRTFSRRDNLTRHVRAHESTSQHETSNLNSSLNAAEATSSPNISSNSADTVTSHAMQVNTVTPPSTHVTIPKPEFTSALNGSCQRYRSGRAENVDLLNYLHSQDHRSILEDALEDLKCLKFFISVKARLVRHDTYRGDGDKEIHPHFTSRALLLTESGDKDELLNLAYNEILERMQKFIREGSGWVLAGVELCDLQIVKYRPLRADSYNS